MRKRLAVLGSVCLGVLVLAAAASAAGTPPAVADCELHGVLTHGYTTAELQHALRSMPVDTREYSDCYTVINQALLAQIKNLHGGDSSGGGSFLPVWLIVVLALLVLGGAGLGVVALRNRGQSPESG